MKDLAYELGVAIKTGKLVLGYKNVVNLILNENPKLVIVSEKTPSKIKETLLYYTQLAKINCITSNQTSLELGANCGKPFPISTIAVLDAGDSDLLN